MMRQGLPKTATKKSILFLILITLAILFFEIFLLWQGERSFRKVLKLKGLNLNNGYLIDTPGCKILNFEVAPKSLQNFYINYNEAPCGKYQQYHNITSAKGSVLNFYPENIHSTYLDAMNREILIDLRNKPKSKEKDGVLRYILTRASLRCCYKVVQRGKPSLGSDENVDEAYQLSHECYGIVKYETIIKNIDIIIVYCDFHKSQDFYVNIHFLVQDKREDKISYETSSKLEDNSGNKLSVIIFGTDSVSRLNFLRINPKTYSYLTEELNAFEFKGYNRIGDNTYPNTMALLTGHFWDEDLNLNCCNKLKSHFDNCSFIWKDFQKKGYITSLVEDCSNLATFNFRKKGFMNPPTDHYLRPGFLAVDKLGNLNCDSCFGHRLTYEVLHEYSNDLQVTYQDGLVFSYIWATSLTHDDMNLGVFTDDSHLRYLKSLKKDRVLNKTILFFLSDHGIRFGSYRQTDMGKYEENLPYLYIVVPEWFHKEFPLASKNLRENGLKFVTPLDIYETLNDILHERYSDTPYISEKRSQHNKRISLFQSLPVTRTCTDVEMPLKYCACRVHVPMEDTDGIFQKIAHFLKQYINKVLDEFQQCAKITTLEVKKAQKVYGDTIGHIISVQAHYNPGGAIIEATIIWDKSEEENPFQISGDISRINRYGNQSHCVDDLYMVKLCICRDMV